MPMLDRSGAGNTPHGWRLSGPRKLLAPAAVLSGVVAADDGGEDDDAPLGPPPDPSLRSWRHPSEIASANAAAARDQEPEKRLPGWPPRRSLTFVGGCALGLLGIFVLGAALVGPSAGPSAIDSAADLNGVNSTESAAVDAVTASAPTTSVLDADATDDPADATDPVLDPDPSETSTTTAIAHLTSPSTLPATLEPGASGVVALLDPSSQAIVATGIVLDGQVLSSSAALADRTQLLVATPDGPIEAIVEGVDPFSDLVVVSVLDPDLLPDPVRTRRAGESGAESQAEPGDTVWLVAAGEQPTPIAVSGELSATGERVWAHNGEMLFDAMHTTIRVPNYGAGAVLLDAEGIAVGMIVSCDRQLGVALPIATLQASADSIRETGWGHLGWLGIEGSLNDEGLVLRSVTSAGPAAAAGLEPGDRLDAVDGQPLRYLAQLVHAVRQAGVGNQIELDVVRGAESFTVAITVGTRIG